MRNWRWTLLLLALLLAWLQYRFWFGPGNSGEVMTLEAQVANQQRDNAGLQQRVVALLHLINPVAMDEGLRFAIREGGRTVGAGVVSKILK